MVKLQCSLSAQNCATLFNPSKTLHKLPYSSQSCVRDPRLSDNVGRCGFPGAACIVDSAGNDNCAYGGDDTIAHYRPLCQNGFCGGGLGAICYNGDYDCNWGYYCNTTYPAAGVCGGQGAFVSDQQDTNVDFAYDYCLSGKAYQASTGHWYCLSGSLVASTSTVFVSPPSSSTSHLPVSATSSKHTLPTGIIAGVCSAVGVIVILAICFLLWRRSRRNQAAAIRTSEKGQDAPPFSGPLPPVSPAISEKPPPSMTSMPSYPTSVFTYLPEIQDDSQRNSNRYSLGPTYPSNYTSTVLPATPSSPSYAYTSSTTSTPPPSAPPHVSSFPSQVSQSSSPNSIQSFPNSQPAQFGFNEKSAGWPSTKDGKV